MTERLDPAGILHTTLNCETITAQATALETLGESVSESGSTAWMVWQGINEHYVAPEGEQLLALMNPVIGRARAVQDDLGVAKTALDTFAEAAKPIVDELVRLKAAAAEFITKTDLGIWLSPANKLHPDYIPPILEGQGVTSVRLPGEVTPPAEHLTWDQYSPWVTENNDRITAVTAQVQLLEDASAACINTLQTMTTDLLGICVAPYEAIPWKAAAAAGQDLPWGSEVPYATSTNQFVNDVFDPYMSGLVDATIEGVTGLVQFLGGYNPETGEWGDNDTRIATLNAMALLLGALVVQPLDNVIDSVQGDDGSGEPDAFDVADKVHDEAVGNSWETLKNGLVGSPEDWAENPSKAAGGLTSTVLSIVAGLVTGGGATAAKAGATLVKISDDLLDTPGIGTAGKISTATAAALVKVSDALAALEKISDGISAQATAGVGALLDKAKDALAELMETLVGPKGGDGDSDSGSSNSSSDASTPNSSSDSSLEAADSSTAPRPPNTGDSTPSDKVDTEPGETPAATDRTPSQAGDDESAGTTSDPSPSTDRTPHTGDGPDGEPGKPTPSKDTDQQPGEGATGRDPESAPPKSDSDASPGATDRSPSQPGDADTSGKAPESPGTDRTPHTGDGSDGEGSKSGENVPASTSGDRTPTGDGTPDSPEPPKSGDGSESSDVDGGDDTDLDDQVDAPENQEEPVASTASAKDTAVAQSEAPPGVEKPSAAEIKANAPKNADGQAIDPRTGDPLRGPNAAGAQGWHIKWDPMADNGQGAFVARNPGDGYEFPYNTKPQPFDSEIGETYSSGDGHLPGEHPNSFPIETYDPVTGKGVKYVNYAEHKAWMDYQAQISGFELGTDTGKVQIAEHVVPSVDEFGQPSSVKFDGHTTRGDPPVEVFLEAKHGYSALYKDPDSTRADDYRESLLDQVERQQRALPPGAILEWHISDAASATKIMELFEKNDVFNVNVLFTPKQ